MIIEGLVSFLCNFVGSIFSNIGNMVTLPTSLINVLSTITGYGSWIIGDDILLVLFSSVAFWFTAKISVGLFRWIWELIPFT